MKIRFKKMHLLGNNFVVINGVNQSFNPNSSHIYAWAKQNNLDFDQLLLIEKPRYKKTDFHYRIFNIDGSEVNQCGNGAICVAEFLKSENLVKNNTIRLSTNSGLLKLSVNKKKEITANLGIPIFESKKIPLISSSNGPFHLIQTPFGDFKCCVLSVGNPHCVLHLNNLSVAPVIKLGHYLNQPPLTYFPKGVNVGFMKIINAAHIALRVYERGVGETQACGSGACAAAIAGQLLKQISKTVYIHFQSGILKVNWMGNGTPVLLTGKGETISQQEMDYP